MKMGERIKERRLAMKYTQEELAEKLGLQKSAIAKYENGRVENIKRSVISKMAHILECSPAYLMGWEKTDEEIADAFQQDMEQEILKKMNSVFSNEKVAHFEKYNQLNEQNMKLVDNYTEKLLSIQEMEEEVYINAAHQRTDIKVPEETDTSDNDIMDDENF